MLVLGQSLAKRPRSWASSSGQPVGNLCSQRVQPAHERTKQNLIDIYLPRGDKRQNADDDHKHDQTKEHQPVQVMHGKDNTDKSVEELQQGEEVPQACLV